MDAVTRLAQERARYVAELDAALKRAVARLRLLPEVVWVGVTGSYARGRRDLFTDLDLVVVMETVMGPVERQMWLRSRLDLRVDADIFCYTPQEWEEMLQRPFGKGLARDLKVLYEREPR
ncbi:MAG TPA: nucleotidyltransferase domain-containing protein [Dehalococcoidia bacterium]|nr:nucleotidyltransferase domain-containing protein [Dehalococcoidia bacterium]